MRVILIAVGLVIGLGGMAEARRGGGGIVVINTGDDIMHLRDLTRSEAGALPAVEDPSTDMIGDTVSFGQLGYRYERFGLFWMDLWRWDGEFVLYAGDVYVPIDDETLAALGGAQVPWRYRLPDGLLIVLALAYLGFIGRRKRSAKAALIIAGVLAAISLAFFLMGLTWEFGIPLVIALHHAIAARSAITHAPEAEPDAAPEPEREPEREPAAEPVIRPHATRAPARASGPHAPISSHPSQPIVIERPSAPAVVPMRADDSVDGPKLLR